ncbi:MAG: thioredoxin domain-containing protein, partial [Microbacteriaceae bacterium]|nr:thioredoxin domain-containing protein [Microbacteriaceae bacterium]
GTLVRTSLAGRISEARATLEDYGMLASGLLDLAAATGEVRYAVVARSLVDQSLVDRSLVDRSLVGQGRAIEGQTFAVPGGADPVLLSLGIALENDPSEGAYPSGLSSLTRACTTLYLITGHLRYRQAAERVIHQLMPVAVPRPVSFGATLAAASALAQPIEQLVVVTDDPHSPLAAVARSLFRSGAISTVLTPAQPVAFADAGFELFEGRQKEAAYLCRSFVCRMPFDDATELAEALGQRG